MNSKKLNVKDMINVGIFATILVVIKIVSGFIGVVPILCVILPAITAVICGPVYLLFESKVQKFGMITILTSILGGIYFLVGYGWPTFVVSILIGFIADLVTKRGNYEKVSYIIGGYCIFALWPITTYINIWMLGDSYFAELSKSMGSDFATEFQSLLPWWSVFWITGLTVVAAIIGGFIGLKMMKKHFEKIGA